MEISFTGVELQGILRRTEGALQLFYLLLQVPNDLLRARLPPLIVGRHRALQREFDTSSTAAVFKLALETRQPSVSPLHQNTFCSRVRDAYLNFLDTTVMTCQAGKRSPGRLRFGYFRLASVSFRRRRLGIGPSAY